MADGDKVKAVPVTIGLQDGQYAELVTGDLKPGQELVTGLEGDERAPVVDLVLLSLRQLRKNTLRSLLTILGVVIGIAAVTVMVSIGQGGQASSSRTSSATSGRTSCSCSRGGRSRPAGSARGGCRRSPAEDSKAIAEECPAVRAASPLVGASGQVVGGNANWKPDQMQGVGPDFLIIRNWGIAAAASSSPTGTCRRPTRCA